MSEINLLPQKQTGGREQKTLTIIRYIAIGMLSLVTLSSAALFFLNIQSPLPKLADSEKQLLNNLAAYDKRANTYQALIDRLNSISQLLSKRSDYSSYIDLVSKQAPTGVVMESVVLSEKEQKTLVFSVSSRSLAPLNTFIDNVSTLGADSKIIKNITLSDVLYDSVRGNYQVKLSFVIL